MRATTVAWVIMFWCYAGSSNKQAASCSSPLVQPTWAANLQLPVTNGSLSSDVCHIAPPVATEQCPIKGGVRPWHEAADMITRSNEDLMARNKRIGLRAELGLEPSSCWEHMQCFLGFIPARFAQKEEEQRQLHPVKALTPPMPAATQPAPAPTNGPQAPASIKSSEAVAKSAAQPAPAPTNGPQAPASIKSSEAVAKSAAQPAPAPTNGPQAPASIKSSEAVAKSAAQPAPTPTNGPQAPASTKSAEAAAKSASGKPSTVASQTPDQVEAAPTLAAQGAGAPLRPSRVAVRAHVTSTPQLAPAPAAASQHHQPPTVPAQLVKPAAAAGSSARVTVAGSTMKVSHLQAVLVLAGDACASL
ncbi:hypothetical protein ABBQ32_009632 [Trebouxia sp. C0010 RCD-2024]